MTAKNDITGDEIKSKVPTDKFRENFDKIFGERSNVPREQRTEKSGTGKEKILRTS